MTTKPMVPRTAEDVALQACFFRLSPTSGRRSNPEWHRIIKHYPRSNYHLSYCGKLEAFSDRLQYSGEWNAGQYRHTWIECDTCERLYLDD